jgi:endoglucanase
MRKWILFLCLPAVCGFAADSNLVRNAGFEDADVHVDWTAFGSAATIGTTTNAFSGSFAGVASNRTQTYGGLAQDMRGLLSSGRTYLVSAWVKVNVPEGVTDQRVQMNVKEQFAGSSVKYVSIGNQAIPDNEWIKVAGIYRYNPTGAEQTLQLYFFGPATAYDIWVDDVEFIGPSDYLIPTNSVATDFIRADGTNLVVGSPAQPIRLQGINLTAYSDDDADPVDSHMADQFRADYENIAELGFNVVRLNMWQKIWDDYTLSFTGYKQEGWDWLERQILWAKENNLYLLLDMHAPAGGYQGPGYATQTDFWGTGTTAVNNRARLTAFWVALADRYKHEPVIAGFDLINEPCPQDVSQWTAYAVELVDAICAVDTHHLIDVEASIDEDMPTIIPRGNILYDFHSYNPWRFAAQFMPSVGYGDLGVWGETNIPAIRWPTAGPSTNFPPSVYGTADWQKYTSGVYVVSSPNDLGLVPRLYCASSDGTAYFDAFTIKEYDPSGNFVRECMAVDPEATPSNPSLVKPVYPFPSFRNAWSTSGGTLSTSASSPHDGAVSFSLSGVGSASNSKLLFPVRQNYRYTIEGWIKAASLNSFGAGFGFQLYTKPPHTTNDWLTREFMEREMLGYGLELCISSNVPCNIGEFGVSQLAISLNRNGLGWVDDMVDICAKYNAGWDYYVYRSAMFGLYNNIYGSGHRPSERNEALYDYFKNKLSGDTDGDGLPDVWEIAHFGSVTNSNGAGDADRDGQTDLDEYIAGTLPDDGASLFKISSSRWSAGYSEIRWSAASGRVYSVYWSSNLLNGFVPLFSNLITGAYTDTLHDAAGQGFYQIETRFGP